MVNKVMQLPLLLLESHWEIYLKIVCSYYLAHKESICATTFAKIIIFMKSVSQSFALFCFQVLELLSCNCKQCDDDCLCSSHGLICKNACSCKYCKNSNEEADEDEYFDNCSESENDSEILI